MKQIIFTLPKVNIFLTILVLSLTIMSCKKTKKEVIPTVRIDFTISLTDPIFFDLNAVGNYVLVDASTNNLGVYASGYDGNGIIIYRAQLDEFIAFDRTCPYDFGTKGLSIAVGIQKGELFAICPECDSKYALPSFGTPSEGPSKLPLKVYKTSLFGKYLRVNN